MPKIKLGDTQLFFDIYGSKLKINEFDVKEKPTLLVLHGAHGMVDHTLYVEFWSQFSNIAQVIFLDQRGCGRSDLRDSSEWNLKYWAQDVYDFCEALNIQRPIVAGVSMGGHVMCEYVKRYPSHAGGLIFCNTEAKLDVEAMIEKFRELGGDEVAEICRKNYLAPTPEIAAAYRDRCVPFYARNAYSKTEVKRCTQHMEVFAHYCTGEANQFDYLSDMNKIQCPTLFMVGEKSPGHPPALAKAMVERMEQRWVHYHEFKDAGAPVYKDSPAESEQVARAFIKTL